MLFFRQLNWNFLGKESRGTSLILPKTDVINARGTGVGKQARRGMFLDSSEIYP